MLFYCSLSRGWIFKTGWWKGFSQFPIIRGTQQHLENWIPIHQVRYFWWWGGEPYQPHEKSAMTSKERANKIISDLCLASAVGDESQKWILTFSHSPSVIKPSQAMGTCKKCSASDALWVRYAVGRLVNRPNRNSSKRRWSLCCDAIDVQSSGRWSCERVQEKERTW